MATEEQALQEIKQKFAGKWKVERGENVEEFFKAIGINFFLRKAASYVNKEVTISVDGQNISVLLKTAVKSDNHVFKLNQEVEIETPKGKAMATTSYENGKLYVVQKFAKDDEIHATREINEAGEMVVTLKSGSAQCKEYLKKLE